MKTDECFEIKQKKIETPEWTREQEQIAMLAEALRDEGKL